MRLLGRGRDQQGEAEIFDQPAQITGTARIGGLLATEVTVAVQRIRDGKVLLSFQGQHASLEEGQVLTIHLKQQIRPD